MRSPLPLLSIGLLWAMQITPSYAANGNLPASNDVQSSPAAIAQWTQDQEERFETQREEDRQRAMDQHDQMRQQLQNAQDEWRNDLREWRTRREEQNDHLREYWEDEYHHYYGDSEDRYIDDHLYRSYGDRPPWNIGDWTFRLYYGDEDFGLYYGSSFLDNPWRYPYRYDDDSYYYEPSIIDRVYVPYPIPTFGNNSLVQVELVSGSLSDVTVILTGQDGSQQLAFDASNSTQSIYLAAGTYQVAFVNPSNNRTWLSGYLDLGFSPAIQIEFNQSTETATLYGDPYAWRSASDEYR
ncbi:MAG: hypothetical protein IGR76_07480 [Synechococcales cyanobacterium T60_A2020_003]|nr:hypothetical protein [Synechococcales cyanobacterium T60_A2020_003]